MLLALCNQMHLDCDFDIVFECPVFIINLICVCGETLPSKWGLVCVHYIPSLQTVCFPK